jgi:hypothetical protein
MKILKEWRQWVESLSESERRTYPRLVNAQRKGDWNVVLEIAMAIDPNLSNIYQGALNGNVRKVGLDGFFQNQWTGEPLFWRYIEDTTLEKRIPLNWNREVIRQIIVKHGNDAVADYTQVFNGAEEPYDIYEFFIDGSIPRDGIEAAISAMSNELYDYEASLENDEGELSQDTLDAFEALAAMGQIAENWETHWTKSADVLIALSEMSSVGYEKIRRHFISLLFREGS